MGTATDEQVDLDIDIDAEVPCSACSSPGIWVGVNLPCKHVGNPVCDEHRKHDDDLMRRAIAGRARISCGICQAVVTDWFWRSL